MRYTAKLIVHEDPKKILKILKPELKQPKSQRAEFKLKKTKDYVEFNITATDSVAMRSVLNSITKLLTVYEKIKGI
ncbi:hypothetical protein HQ529_04415 [Candidatus Woesearchaeota archaeon]|nr:hypothetical protein [Candidatus Woesearchaeota archaeon]